jgi:hypothetical protein
MNFDIFNWILERWETERERRKDRLLKSICIQMAFDYVTRSDKDAIRRKIRENQEKDKGDAR